MAQLLVNDRGSGKHLWVERNCQYQPEIGVMTGWVPTERGSSPH